MLKAVHLGPSLSFESITSAKVYYDPIRTGGLIDVDVSPQHFEDLTALYVAYCRKTNYNIPSEIVAFYPTIEKRNGGYTRCLGVRFKNNSTTTFSLDKALSAVASAS